MAHSQEYQTLSQMKLQQIWRVSKLEAEKTDQDAKSSIKSMELSNQPYLGSEPCLSPPTKPEELYGPTNDSGYGSATRTPTEDAAIPLRKPGQVPLISQMGLFICNKGMDPKTKQRFLKVQREIEKMLLDFIRKLKSGSGRCKPIAIRPMMLGKTNSDADAEPYMVVICSEDMKRKIQDFFNESLVTSLCEPGDDDVPSFKALVIGHALRLRASTSDISVQCSPMHDFWDGTTTFCGMPIRLCDERGHSRNATFGGMVKITCTDEEYQLYGLTAGHMIKGDEVVKDEKRIHMDSLEGSDPVDLDIDKQPTDASDDQISTIGNHDDQNDSAKWCFGNGYHLGNVLDADREKALVNEEQGQATRPYLDWALFELNAYRPNQLAFRSQEASRGDLHLPSLTEVAMKDEISVSMLCASQEVKRGVLSTTRARVLLYPGDSFTDAYILSLEGSRGKYISLIPLRIKRR